MENGVSHFRRMNNYIKKPTYGGERYLAMDVAVVIQLKELNKTAAMLSPLPKIKALHRCSFQLSTPSHRVLMSGLAFGQR